MAFPKGLAGMLKSHPEITRTRELTSIRTCQGAKFHSPNPLEVHRVLIRQASVYLCGTCRDNLSLLQDLLKAEGGSIDWVVYREFGTRIRDLARERTQNG
jgi:hypothetical protein